MPEVSLVAILDADKEGFLRSETSLIQTIGRAARNLQGKAILYADRMTGSMQRAIDETDRRRKVQEAYNLEHGIEPKGITKSVADIMEGARYTPGRKSRKGGRKAAEPKIADYADEVVDLTPKELSKKIRGLEEKMHQHARDLEFEDAAALRDQLQKLKGQVFAGID